MFIGWQSCIFATKDIYVDVVQWTEKVKTKDAFDAYFDVNH